MRSHRDICSLVLPVGAPQVGERAVVRRLRTLETGAAAEAMSLVAEILAADPTPFSVHLVLGPTLSDGASSECITFSRVLAKALPMFPMYLADPLLAQSLFVSSLDDLQILGRADSNSMEYRFPSARFEQALAQLTGKIERSMYPESNHQTIGNLRENVVALSNGV